MDLASWQRDGWTQLRGFFPSSAVDAINAAVDRLWVEKPRNVTVDDIDARQRTRFSRLRDGQREHRIKISDLYLTHPLIRATLLDERLLRVVGSLLGDTPVLCNSLNLEHSSAQEYHADSLYMTPRTPGRLVAIWIALEDVRRGSGPLRFYPGSHRLPMFRFANGGRSAVSAEMPAWAKHMQHEIDAREMEPHVVYANAGDVVMWHADLLHGAEEIRDASLTRRSLVAHYLGREDCAASGYTVVRDGAGHWFRRLPQPVNGATRMLSALERRWHRLRARP